MNEKVRVVNLNGIPHYTFELNDKVPNPPIISKEKDTQFARAYYKEMIDIGHCEVLSPKSNELMSAYIAFDKLNQFFFPFFLVGSVALYRRFHYKKNNTKTKALFKTGAFVFLYLISSSTLTIYRRGIYDAYLAKLLGTEDDNEKKAYTTFKERYSKL